MTEYSIYPIDPDKDLPTLRERVLRLPAWRRRDTLSYICPDDRLQSAIAFELLAELLNKRFCIPYDGFMLVSDSRGKPRIFGRNDIHISLAHCRKGVLAVVSDTPVGCDIEEIQRPYLENGAMIADYCFTDNERRDIAAANDPALEFTKIWTVKEALFKLDNSLDIENIDTTLQRQILIRSSISSDYVATIAEAKTPFTNIC